MKKKGIIYLIIILSLTFSLSISVKAESLETTKGITYDKDISKEGDSNSKYVKSNANLIVYDVGTELKSTGYVNTNSDTFKAYKVLNTYYNSSTNEISYDFTSDFKKFLNSLDNSDSHKDLTISQYLNLTSDKVSDNENMSNTTSTLNVLVSKYATYIRNNPGLFGVSNNNVFTMTNSNYDNENDNEDAIATGVEAGSYLVLPNSVTVKEKFNAEKGYSGLATYIYGAMVGNVTFAVSNGNWAIQNATINAKSSVDENCALLYPLAINELVSFANNSTEDEIGSWINSHSMGQTVNLASGKSAVLKSEIRESGELPANTNQTIKNNSDIEFLLDAYKIELAPGLSYDYSFVESVTEGGLIEEGNKYYKNNNGNPGGLLIEKINDQAIYYNFGDLALDIILSNSYNFTAGADNNVTATTYYVKDPYVDIGSNVTKEDIETALKADGDNAIKKAIGTRTQVLNIRTYGLTINNKNTDNNNLTGAKFSVCRDSACNDVIKSNIDIDNGTGSFVGVSGEEPVYIVQTKAPAGYTLADPVLVNLPTLVTDPTHFVDNYFLVDITNQAILSLPFTGGVGTIIYAGIGLLIVIGSIMAIVVYKKNTIKNL